MKKVLGSMLVIIFFVIGLYANEKKDLDPITADVEQQVYSKEQKKLLEKIKEAKELGSENLGSLFDEYKLFFSPSNQVSGHIWTIDTAMKSLEEEPQSHYKSSKWSEFDNIVTVAYDDQKGISSCIGIDGTIYTAMENDKDISQTTNKGISIYKSIDNGKSWMYYWGIYSTINDLSLPDIDISNDGKIFITYRRNEAQTIGVAVLETNGDAVFFTISGSNNGIFRARISVEPNTSGYYIYVVYSVDSDLGNDIWLSLSLDKGTSFENSIKIIDSVADHFDIAASTWGYYLLLTCIDHSSLLTQAKYSNDFGVNWIDISLPSPKTAIFVRAAIKKNYSSGYKAVILTTHDYSPTDFDITYYYTNDGLSYTRRTLSATTDMEMLGDVYVHWQNDIFHTAYFYNGSIRYTCSSDLDYFPTSVQVNNTSDVSNDDYVNVVGMSNGNAAVNWVSTIFGDYDVLSNVKDSGDGWADGFEDYETGLFPSSWIPDGNATNSDDNFVTNNTSSEGSKSLRLHGSIGGCWAALVYHPLVVSAPYEVEVTVKNGNESLGGCHPDRASISIRQGESWTNPARGFIGFKGNGDIVSTSSGLVLGSFEMLSWYVIRIRYELIESSQVRISYWINGDYKASEIFAAHDEEIQITNLQLAVQEGTAWFDNVRVYPINITSIGESSSFSPSLYQLQQNYPNPFNPVTNIVYALPNQAFVNLAIFNIAGQQVASLVNATQPAGYQSIQFYPVQYNLSSGVYFYQLRAGNYTKIRKMVYMK